jgi:hypothetical protein
MEEGKDDLVLSRTRHFSRSGLSEFLNTKYGKKSNGSQWKPSDIQQYAIKGALPSKYGGHPCKEIKDAQFGLFVEVDFGKTV